MDKENILLWALWHDFFVILPILFCSVILGAIALNRWFFYEKNKRDIVQFISRLQRELPAVAPELARQQAHHVRRRWR